MNLWGLWGAWGYPKHPTFNWKNQVHFWWYEVVEGIKNYLHELFFHILKKFLKFVCFPRFYGQLSTLRMTLFLPQNDQISSKWRKINECWFLSKFHRQIFSFAQNTHWVWFMTSDDNFSSIYVILNKKNFCKPNPFFSNFQK